MSPSEVQHEVHQAWREAYGPAATRRAIDMIANEPAPYKISHLIARLFFRGIYFPNKGAWAWIKAIAENGGTVLHVVHQCFTNWRGRSTAVEELNFDGPLPGPVAGD